MSEVEDSQAEKTPAVGDAVLVESDEGDGSFNEHHITEAYDFDEEKGLYKVSCDNGEEYNVYWSEEEDSWVHSDD